MKNKYALIVFFELMFSGAVCLAGLPIKLSTDKSNYLPYEPVYLKIERADPKASNIKIRSLEYGDFGLEIGTPRGASSSYKPSVSVCLANTGVEKDESVAFSILILNNAKLVTSESGTYVLTLYDHERNQLAWPINFNVAQPTLNEDREAMKIIESAPYEYGLFAYLEGGDHIEKGIGIFKKLASTKSMYRSMARTVLAMNYSEDALSDKTGLIMRKKNPEFVRQYSEGFDDATPEYLQLQTSHKILANLKHEEIPSSLLSQIGIVKKRFSGKVTPGFFKNVKDLN
jgi:hypothetical protein